jgi:RNA polymerase sigma-70 factor (ECF subfamily)
MNLSGEAQENEPGLVDRARQGDGAAWEALVQTHQEAVFRLAYLLLGDPDEAEDAAQEAFLRAFRALERFDASRPLRPWLLSIAANLARNRRRSLGRYLTALQRLVRLEPPYSANIEDKSAERWQAQSLWRAVQRLSEPDQQVIYLRYFLEMSVEETAEATGVAEGTVKSRLHRALERLRTVIERDFPSLRESIALEGTDG